MTTMSKQVKQFSFIFLIFTVFLTSSCTNSEPTIDFSDRMSNLVPSEGTLSPDFSTLVLFYDLLVSEEVDSITLTPTLEGEDITVEVNDVLAESGSPSQVIDLTSGDNKIRVDVVSDTTTYNYVVSIIRSESANAFLSDLTLSEGQFSPELEENSVSISGYEVTVPFTTSSINLTATLADPAAGLTINGIELASAEISPDISLNEGDNAIDIVVTAQNQFITQTYQLNVVRSFSEEFAFYTYFKATNTESQDFFGSGTAIWGNTLVVGAPGERSNATGVNGDQSDNSGVNPGAAYVYEKDTNGLWSFRAYLKPIGDNSRNFGRNVAISNDFIAINADNSFAGQSGQVHIYRRDASNHWIVSDFIESPNLDSGESFGVAIELSNKTLIVGAYLESNSPIDSVDPDAELNQSAGAVYVYELSDNGIGSSSQQAYIRGSNTGAFDLFGASIALSGNTLAVGAYGEDSNATGVNGNQSDNSLVNSGAVYIFTYNDESGWMQQAYIKASNTHENDFFGISVSLSGDTLLVGADREDGQATDSGAAYIFTRDSSSNWSQQAYLKPNYPENGSLFGNTTYISGDTVIVGSKLESSDSTGIDGAEEHDSDKVFSGAAYLFTRNDSNLWTQKHYIKAPNTDTSDLFASRVSGYADDLIFSAPGEASAALFNEGGESDNLATDAGAAYIYRNSPFTTHNLALSLINAGSTDNSITAINLDTGFSLSDCNANCSQLVIRGQTIQLTPVAGGAAEFVGWEGEEVCLSDVDEAGAITVTILAETFCTAVFREIEINLTIDKDASSTADGLIVASHNSVLLATCDIGCDSATSDPLELDSEIQISATAENGAFVAAWSGNAECQDNATSLNTITSVSMSSSKTCTALFSFPDTRELRVSVDAFGSASGFISAVNLSTSVALDDCDTDCSQQITQGHSIQLTPHASDEFSEFINWSGDVECNNNADGSGDTTVSLDADIHCSALFGEIVVEDIILIISKNTDSTADGLIQASSNDNVLVSCDIGCSSDASTPLTAGSIINFTATPEDGAVVTAWTGDAECQANASTDNTTTSITMTVSKTCIAQFDFPATHELRVLVDVFNSSGVVGGINVDTGIALDDCSSDCSQQVNTGQTVQLTPVAGNASEFSHWSGDDACRISVTETGVTDVLISADTQCTANFIPAATGDITLTITKTIDNTSLDGDVQAINNDIGPIATCNVGCTSDTSAVQFSGTHIDIFATPEDSFASVLEWTGDPQCAANASADKTFTSVILTRAITCTVKFSAPL